MVVTIVLSYGVFEKHNLQYQSYLDEALKLIADNNSDIVITTGGCSNKNLPNLSEANSSAEYLISQFPELEGKITLEDKSLSTPQNLEFCAEILKSKNIDKIIITCDNIRAPKTYFLALWYFNDLLALNLDEKKIYEDIGQKQLEGKFNIPQLIDVSYKNLQIIGIPLGRTLEETGYQITSTLLETTSFRYPDLNQKFIEWRKKQWGVK